jgi:hypothetical protein
VIATDALQALRDLGAGATIVVHADCADGVASALLLRDAFPRAEVRFVQYDTAALRDLPAVPGMLFCDITPPRERVAEFVAAGTIVLDHHGTQRDIVAAFGDRGVFADEATEPGVSGAALAFREVWRRVCRVDTTEATWSAANRLATLAGVRDTWQRRDPRWPEACAQAAALRFWPEEVLFGDDGAVSGPEGVNWSALEARLALGPTLLEKQAVDVTRALAGALAFTVGATRMVAFQETGNLVSDAAEICGGDADLVASFSFWCEEGRPAVVFSLRSRCDFRCDLFAEHFGGGGHQHAAGFKMALPEAMAAASPYGLLAVALRAYQGPDGAARRFFLIFGLWEPLHQLRRTGGGVAAGFNEFELFVLCYAGALSIGRGMAPDPATAKRLVEAGRSIGSEAELRRVLADIAATTPEAVREIVAAAVRATCTGCPRCTGGLVPCDDPECVHCGSDNERDCPQAKPCPARAGAAAETEAR